MVVAGKVAIVGAGRLGRLLAERLPAGCRKVVIDRQRTAAQAVADEVGGVATDSLAAVRGASAVLLTVPDAAVAGLLSDLAAFLEPEAVVVNLAAGLPTAELAAQFPALRLVGAKLLGTAGEMLRGAPGALVIEGASPADERFVAELLSGLGTLLPGREVEAQQAVAVVHEELAHALESARRRLHDLGLAPQLIDATLGAAAPGVLRELSSASAATIWHA